MIKDMNTISKLELRGLKYSLFQIDNFEESFQFEKENDDDETVVEYTRGVVFVNEKHQVSIIIKEYRFEDEEFDEDISSIAVVTSDDAYEYLIEYLNTHDNTTVSWTQVYGTTSCWDVFENTFIIDPYELKDIITSSEFDGDIEYKYCMAKIDRDNNTISFSKI